MLEPQFVPRHDAAVCDDGFLMTMLYDHNKDRSALVILDASSLDEHARCWFDGPLPWTFHGRFFPRL